MKNLKRNYLFILLVCLTVTVSVALSSCDIFSGGEETPTECQHELTAVAEVKATCTEAGTEGYYKCSGCDKLFADAEGSVEIEAPKSIEELGHSFTSYASDNNATCTADGTKTAKCDNCEATDTKADEGSMKDHSFTSYVSDNNATCTADGTKTAKCDNCDATDTKADEGSMGDHSFTSYVSNNDATCTADGTKTAKCDNCDATDTKADEGSMVDHSFTSYVSNNDATCTADGTKTAKCDNCDATDTKADEGSMKDHSFTSYVSNNDATCTTDGTKTAKCDNCNATDTKADEGSMVDHSFTSYVSNNDATCTADGTKTAKCDNCDATDTKADEGSKKDHTPAEAVKENIVNATCAKDGSYELVVYCSVENCKYEISREKFTVKATGEHVYATEQEKVAATCTADGYVIMACGCGATEKTTLTATGHSYESKVTAPTCTAAGYTTYTCSACGDSYTADEVAALGHSYEAVVTAPTCTAAGFTTYTCSACGDSYTADEVAALGHNWTGYELITAPTYESTGILGGTCANCDAPTYELPVVSAENGYTALITGVLTRWQYTYNDFTFTVDLENTDATTNTYSYGVEAWYVGLDADGNPIMESGYKATTATWNTTFFGGKNYNYTTTIFAPNDTTVTLIFRAARNKTKPFFSDGVEWVLNDLFVNGSADGVIADTSSQVIGGAWTTFNDYQVATLFLKKGANTVTFRTANSTNFAGIGFISTEELHMHTDVIDNAVAATCFESGLTQGIHCSECNEVIIAQETIPTNGDHTFETYSMITTPDYTSEGQLVKKCTLCGVADEESVVVLPKISEENGYVKVSSTDTEEEWQYTYAEQTFDIVIATSFDFVAFVNDPFIAENGGSISGTVSVTNDVPRYQKTYGQTFTATITVSSDTVADFIIKVENGTKTNTYAGLFSSITLDGANVTINDGSVTGQGWGNSIDIIVASLNLTKGTHVITFTRNSDTGSTNNFNIWGIGFTTSDSVSITLGSAE